jgi:nucleoside-diphosphate-sugar epimerase
LQKIKKKVLITGGDGLLGSYFYKKYKSTYSIKKYPFRIQKFNKFEKWVSNKKFDYFIHFAAITKNESKKYKNTFNLINVKSPINIMNLLNKRKSVNLVYFLFISSSHVYGFSKHIIKENKKRNPQNVYGKSKKKVEDYILKNRKNFSFKIGIARIFNSTGPKQKKGNFVPDMIAKMKKVKKIENINQFRDFIHIDDVAKSIKILIEKKIEKPINLSSGKKINLIKACKIINKKFVKKKGILFDLKRGNDIFGDNTFLKKLGLKRFKNVNQALLSYKK